MSDREPINSPPADHPKLGVAVPLANQEQTIREFLDRVLAQLLARDRVFCVVDRVCQDRTKELVIEHAARDPRVAMVWAPQDRCVVDAYFAGYRAALADGCEWILEMDGGFSHLPEEIPLFLKGMAAGFDYVGGSRFMPGGSHRSPWNRVLISKGGTLLTKLLLRARMTDLTSGFECFNRKAMTCVLERGVASRANFFQTEIRLMMQGFRWLEVPITYRNTSHRIGRRSLREALRVLWALYRARRAKGRAP